MNYYLGTFVFATAIFGYFYFNKKSKLSNKRTDSSQQSIQSHVMKTAWKNLLNEINSNSSWGSDNDTDVDLIETLSEEDTSHMATLPTLTGITTPTLYEIHIFLGPVKPLDDPIDESLIEKYKKLVELYNLRMENTYPYFKNMKPPILALKFRDHGYLTVMQSSMYFSSDNYGDVLLQSHNIANLFKLAGFEVIREKIEVSVDGVNGIPQTDEDAKKFGKYFEFHIRVARKDDTANDPLTNDEIESLEKASTELTEHFDVPVPLSYNLSKEGETGGYQRYLNIRCRGVGMQTIENILSKINSHIVSTTPFEVKKVIREYVVYDTFTELDKGWIDFP